MKCPFCEYEWEPRVKGRPPKTCTRCKRYLPEPKHEEFRNAQNAIIDLLNELDLAPDPYELLEGVRQRLKEMMQAEEDGVELDAFGDAIAKEYCLTPGQTTTGFAILSEYDQLGWKIDDEDGRVLICK